MARTNTPDDKLDPEPGTDELDGTDDDGGNELLIGSAGVLRIPAGANLTDEQINDLATQFAALPTKPGPAIYRAIAAAMLEAHASGGVGKTDKAPPEMGGYNYRGIEATTRHLAPLCGKHGIIAWPRARLVDCQPAENMKKGWYDWRVEVTYNVAGLDGVKLDPPPVVQGIGRDATDKGINKAMSAAYKYLLLQLFMVSDGKDDTDAADYSKDRVQPVDGPPEAPFVDEAVRDQLRAEIAALSEDQRAAVAADWSAEDPMTGESFLPLGSTGKPAVGLLRETMVPAVRAMIARVKKGQTALPGGGPGEARRTAPNGPLADPGSGTADEPDTATERLQTEAADMAAEAEAGQADAPEGEDKARVDEAMAKVEASVADAKAAAAARADAQADEHEAGEYPPGHEPM